MTKYLPGDAKRVGSAPLVETFWLHHDHQGSIQAITDATGAEVQRFLYYPYGDRIATATAHDESKGWIGERQDATGLFYLHARYYDPVIGRFNSADPSDPLASGVGLNRYAYAGNNPVMRVDPWGLLYAGNDDSSGGGTTKYTDRTSHGSMTPSEARWRSKAPSAVVKRNVQAKYEQQLLEQKIQELYAQISTLDFMRSLPYSWEPDFLLSTTNFQRQKTVKGNNNVLERGWGEWTDLSEWMRVEQIYGSGEVIFNAGDMIAIAASSIAYPPTYQFGFNVHIHPLDAYGNLATIYTTREGYQSVYYSSGFTGAGSPNVFVIRSPYASAGGQQWTVSLQQPLHTHDNVAWGPYVDIYVPRNGQ